MRSVVNVKSKERLMSFTLVEYLALSVGDTSAAEDVESAADGEVNVSTADFVGVLEIG
jgi:hypothetical protein